MGKKLDMRSLRLSMIAAAAMIAAPAMAQQSSLNADSIVDFFARSADLGAARGICIGTAQECNRSNDQAAGLDMLINFDLDSAELTPEARANLEEFAKALKDDRLRAARFTVEGHTDASGGERYNDELSERRAQSVTSFLLDRGVRPDKVTAIGLGKSQPRVENPFDPVNRRVEMRINLR